MVTRSRWRGSSGTRRRAASRTSTVTASPGSACRTAAVSTAGSPASAARPSRRAAWPRLAGVPSGPPWWTTSMTMLPRGSTSIQACSRARARSGRRSSRARPTSEPGPSSTVRARSPVRGSVACSASSAALLTGGAALPGQVGAGHQAAQPPPPGAGGGTTSLPAGEDGDARVARVDVDTATHRVGPAPRAARGGRPPRCLRPAGRPGPAGRAEGADEPGARSEPGGGGLVTARSTPSTGAMPASSHACTNRMAP